MATSDVQAIANWHACAPYLEEVASRCHACSNGLGTGSNCCKSCRTRCAWLLVVAGAVGSDRADGSTSIRAIATPRLGDAGTCVLGQGCACHQAGATEVLGSSSSNTPRTPAVLGAGFADVHGIWLGEVPRCTACKQKGWLELRVSAKLSSSCICRAAATYI